MPELAQELKTLLTQKGELTLAAQVQRLHILDRCRCGDSFCAMFYTVPRPSGTWGAGHRNVLSSVQVFEPEFFETEKKAGQGATANRR